MGLNSHTFSREQLRGAGLERLASGRVRPKLGPALMGFAWWFLAGDPPTVTHHAKQIAMRGKRRTLVDTPALQAARQWYLQRIPERSTLVPIASPCTLKVTWRFELPEDRTRWPDGAIPGAFREDKPDLDNLLKTVKDVLVERGWMIDDSNVVLDGGSSKRWCAEHDRPGVHIQLRSLYSACDSGAAIQPGPGQEPNELHPAPWVISNDVAIGSKIKEAW